jgi:hypothetical protein
MVFKRIRELFGKERKDGGEIPFGELPELLNQREQKIAQHLEKEVSIRRPQILKAIEKIQEILDSFAEIERKPSSHPKLERIAQSSLPHFVHSISQHIGRPLPTAPEEFYQDAASLLKSCITTMRGTGKYLPMVFPDEMKALRLEIGVIGRSMNELTSAFSLAAKNRQAIASLRKISDAIYSLGEEQERREICIEKLENQLRDIQVEKEGIGQSLKSLEKSGEFRILEEERSNLARKEKDVTNLRLQKDQTIGTVLSVYRRASRIARHHNDDSTEKRLEEVIGILESPRRDCTQMRESIRLSIPTLLVQIQTGILTLKGQDEQYIFSSPALPYEEVSRACIEIQTAVAEVDEMRTGIQKLPVHEMLLHLKGEEGRVIHRYEKLSQRLSEEKEKWEELRAKVLTGKQELHQQVSAVMGQEFTVVFDQSEKHKDQ